MMLKGLVGKRPKRESIWAVKDLSFEVKRGEALGIIGPNGSGKTTVLKLLSNVTKQTSGTIVTEGRVSALIELGAGFHPDLSGRENVYLNGSILGLKKSEIDKKFDAIVAFSGIEKFIDTPVKYYSSGMYVRLGFSVAAHVDPDILLIDEVLAVGDMAFKRKSFRKMTELRNNTDTTIVFVSHDLRSVETVCKNTIFLLDGKSISYGTTADIIMDYQNYELDKFQDVTLKTKEMSEKEDVFIKEILLLDEQGRARDTFFSGEKVTVRVKYLAPIKVKSPIFVIRVERRDGLACFIVRSRHTRVITRDIAGEGYFEAEFNPINLNAGIYNLQAAIKDSRDILVHAGKTRSFKVLLQQVDFGANTGIYFPEVKWKQGR